MKPSLNYSAAYLDAVQKLTATIDPDEIEKIVGLLVDVKKRQGRLFLLGVGGSAANCSHAVNDFRKICGIETYAPTDNVSELTARANDDGWDTIFSNWLKVSKLSSDDIVMVFSVGGGNVEKNISTNIVKALQLAQEVGTTITGIVSRDGGYTRKVAHASILLSVSESHLVTPLAESFQAVIWHAIATHPSLAK